MRGESWANHLVLGLLVLVAGVIGATEQIEQRQAWQRVMAQPVIESSVQGSAALSSPASYRTRLVDLFVDCERMISIDGHVYVLGHGGGWRDLVIVEVAPGEECDATVARVHRIEPAAPELAAAVLASRDLPVHYRPALARPPSAEPLSPAMAIGVVLVGLAWLLYALGMRRAYRAAVAEAMARAATPRRARAGAETTSAQGPYRAEAEAGTVIPRPLKLRSRVLVEQRRQGIAANIAAWSITALTLAYVGYAGHEQWSEQQRWETGIPARDVSGSGDSRSHVRGVFRSASFRYVYYDAGHRPHVGERSFTTLFGPELRGGDFKVRYHASEPSVHAVGWTGEDTAPLWMALLLYAGLGVLFGGACFMVARRALAAPRRWTAVLEHPEEVELVVKSKQEVLNRGTPTGVVLYTFAVPGSDQPFEYRAPDPSRSPFFLDLDQTRALGLRNPKKPGAVMVLRADLSPLEVDAGLEQEIRARAKEARKASR